MCNIFFIRLYCDRPNHVVLKYRRFSTDNWMPGPEENQLELFDLDTSGDHKFPSGELLCLPFSEGRHCFRASSSFFSNQILQYTSKSRGSSPHPNTRNLNLPKNCLDSHPELYLFLFTMKRCVECNACFGPRGNQHPFHIGSNQ